MRFVPCKWLFSPLCPFKEITSFTLRFVICLQLYWCFGDVMNLASYIDFLLIFCQSYFHSSFFFIQNLQGKILKLCAFCQQRNLIISHPAFWDGFGNCMKLSSLKQRKRNSVMSMTIILICGLKTFVISEFDCCRPSFVESMFDSVLKFCYLMIGTNHDKELFRHMGLQLCKLPRNTFLHSCFLLLLLSYA